MVQRPQHWTIRQWMATKATLLGYTNSRWASLADSELELIIHGLQRLAPLRALQRYVRGTIMFPQNLRADTLWPALTTIADDADINPAEWKTFQPNGTRNQRLANQVANLITTQPTSSTLPAGSQQQSGNYDKRKKFRQPAPQATQSTTGNTEAARPRTTTTRTNHTDPDRPYCTHHKKYGHHTSECRKFSATQGIAPQPPPRSPPQPSRPLPFCQNHNRFGHSTANCRREGLHGAQGGPPQHPPRAPEARQSSQGNRQPQPRRSNVYQVDQQRQPNHQAPTNQNITPNTSRPNNQNTQQGNYTLPGHNTAGLGIINYRR